MDNEVYSFALRSALNEVRNICPDIKSSFMFREDGEVVAADESTPERTIVQVVDSLDGVFEKADALGGVEAMCFEGSKGRVNVSSVNSHYLVTVTSRKADLNLVNTVTRVLIPTVLKLLEKISPMSVKSDFSTPNLKPEIPLTKEMENPEGSTAEEDRVDEPKKILEPEIKTETPLPEPPVNQFIVENLGGLLVPSDTARIDNEIILQWNELYPDRKITDVSVETFSGKETRCKVKPIKDSKFEGKGIIQTPDKIQLSLEIKKGELVRVRPVIE